MLEAVDHIAENYHEQKCNELLTMIQNIHKRNGNKAYTNIMLKHAAEVYQQVKHQQSEEIQATMKSLESNSQQIKELKVQINNTTITTKDKTAINKEIAALQKENEYLEKQLKQ